MGKLVRIELFNFKSYKGHHVLHLGDSYFTSIVGPNGSGKSNSMDAISFVLGVKSSHLRSANLKDLVYRGRILKSHQFADNGDAIVEEEPDDTDGPVDADPKTAWVMAVYEDDTGDELRWKRTITRQGTSEFSINSKTVSAKAYTEALEDQNILIKARNFLVFQGDVEAVASQTPKDLTRLVEQISGSLEYKAEHDRLYAEAQKSTEDQSFKVNQRRGINAEIRQLSEQKKEADDYQSKVKERDQLLVKHSLWKLFHFQKLIDETDSEIEKCQDEIREYKTRLDRGTKELDEAREQHAMVSTSAQQSQQATRKIERSIQSKQDELLPVEEKMKITEREMTNYKSRIAEVTKERDVQTTRQANLNKNLDTVLRAQSKWQSDQERAAAEIGIQLSDADLQQYNELKGQVTKQTAASQLKLDRLKRQQAIDAESSRSAQTRVDELERSATRLSSFVSELSTQKQERDADVKSTSRAVDQRRVEINKLSSTRLSQSRRQTELDEKLQVVLQKLLEAADGRRESEREIRNREVLAMMKRLFPGVRGRVHELCKPKQKKYETAVSTVLGRHFDAIVVDTEEIAKDCISYLREQRAGQGTFIPLDSIQSRSVDSLHAPPSKAARLALDCIDFDPALERAMVYSCGNAVIADDLETAKRLSFETRLDAKVVTIEGVVIHKAGLMTGGRGPNDRNNKKWNDSEIEQWQRQRDRIVAELETMQRSHKSVQEEEELQAQLAKLEQSLEFAQQQANSLQLNLDSKKKEADFVKSELSEAQKSLHQAQSALQKSQQDLSTLEEEVHGVEDAVFTQFCQRLGLDNIRVYEQQHGSLQQEASQKELEFKKQISKIKHQLEFEEQSMNSVSTRLSALEGHLERSQELVNSLNETREILLENISSEKDALEEQKRKSERLRKDLDKAKEKVNNHRRAVEGVESDVEQVNKSMNGLQAEAQRTHSQRFTLLRRCRIDEIQIPLSKGSKKLSSLPMDDAEIQEMQRELGDEGDDTIMDTGGNNSSNYGIVVDFDTLDEELQEDGSEETGKSIEEELHSVEQALTTLNPNMRAMERLRAANDRLASSEEAFQEAREATKSARAAYEEVREKRAELFTRAFKHISEAIDGVYKSLTKSTATPLGGQAYLDQMSSDAERPFDGGLKYHAMPPTKRFRDMEALSGGEKTIAALALLFAVHSFAPSPFFVLDEVDAALDNANVSRVASYMRRHAGPGMQFIVISLKNTLFQESECLVGVMRDQDQNSSRALTLDLRQYPRA